MKRSNLKALKKSCRVIFSLLFVFVFLTFSSVTAQEGSATGASAGDAGLGAAATIGPLGIAAIAAGTLAAMVVIADAVTDSDSTTQHVTPSHHGN